MSNRPNAAPKPMTAAEPSRAPTPEDPTTGERRSGPAIAQGWLFWDDSSLAARSPEELAAYIDALRQTGRTRRLLEIARRFVERGRGADTIRLFRPEEIRRVLEDIKRSRRGLAFVDPVRISMYERYLREREPEPTE